MKTVLKDWYWNSGASFDSDYQAVLDRGTALGATLPSADQQVIQNQFVLDLKSAGIWSKLDFLYVPACDGNLAFTYINWITPASFYITKTGTTPTFTSNLGWDQSTFNSHLSTGFIPNTHGVNFTLNDASVFYLPTNTTFANFDFPIALAIPTQYRSTALLRCTLNSGAAVDSTGSQVANSVNHFQRTTSTHVQFYSNAVSKGNIASASTSRSTSEIRLILNTSNGAMPGISVVGGGASLAGLHTNLNTLVKAYRAAL